MKFRRKATQQTESSTETPVAAPTTGPFDISEIRDEVERLDVGALLIAPLEGLELRLQVNEKTEEVGAALLAGPEGAMELQAYAAPASGGLWDEVRPQIAADVAGRGGATEERDGDFGTELLCRVPAKLPDGTEGFQPSRIIAVERGRWMLRATLLGRPAMDSEAARIWEDALRLVAVRRGEGAMPVGKQIPLVLPSDARRV